MKLKDTKFLHNQTNLVEGNAGYGKEIRYIEEYQDFQIKERFNLSILEYFELPIEFANKLKKFSTLTDKRLAAMRSNIQNSIGKEVDKMSPQEAFGNLTQ